MTFSEIANPHLSMMIKFLSNLTIMLQVYHQTEPGSVQVMFSHTRLFQSLPQMRLPERDTMSQEVRMTDKEFDKGLTQAVYRVLNDKITDLQPEAGSKLPPIQLSNTDTRPTRSKRVKFATKWLIAQ